MLKVIQVPTTNITVNKCSETGGFEDVETEVHFLRYSKGGVAPSIEVSFY